MFSRLGNLEFAMATIYLVFYMFRMCVCYRNSPFLNILYFFSDLFFSFFLSFLTRFNIPNDNSIAQRRPHHTTCHAIVESIIRQVFKQHTDSNEQHNSNIVSQPHHILLEILLFSLASTFVFNQIHLHSGKCAGHGALQTSI